MVYAERRDVRARLVRTHLAGFLEARVPAGGMQMPCRLVRDLPEREAVERARRAGIDLLGLTSLHAPGRHAPGWPGPGFLMGFAAHAPGELDLAVRTLAKVLRGLGPR